MDTYGFFLSFSAWLDENRSSIENTLETNKIKTASRSRRNIHIHTRKLLTQTPTWPCICLHFYDVVILPIDYAPSIGRLKPTKTKRIKLICIKNSMMFLRIILYKKFVSESWPSYVRQVLGWPRNNRQRCGLTSSFLLPLVVDVLENRSRMSFETRSTEKKKKTLKTANLRTKVATILQHQTIHVL